MNINTILLQNFRNYTREKAEFSSRSNLITGRNGHGKTNLLEAVHYCCLGFSPRTKSDREIIKWGQNSFVLRVRGSVDNEQEEQVQSVQIFESGEKQIKVNNTAYRRLSDLMGRFALVWFAPEDLEIVDGGPSVRRRFLDSLICQYSGEYLSQLRKYNRIVKQRNAMLREMDKYNEKVFEVLNEQFAAAGPEIIENRLSFIRDFKQLARENYEKIAAGHERLELRYVCSMGEEASEGSNLIQIFKEKLEQIRDAEMEQKTTLIGPHRDNLLFFINKKSARRFGSQGQKRLISLSLKLASANVLERQYKQPPILILDDVFAELDRERKMRLGKMIGNSSQLLIASPQAEEIPFPVERGFLVEDGILKRL
jgi:DNA replication and repair protein RecF